MINGDFVDFLAETDKAGAFVPFTRPAQEAAAKLEAIAAREGAVFTALGTFLARGHRLALDAALLRRGPEDFQFIYDGEAYVGLVG